jgi:hypothetical protein
MRENMKLYRLNTREQQLSDWPVVIFTHVRFTCGLCWSAGLTDGILTGQQSKGFDGRPHRTRAFRL